MPFLKFILFVVSQIFSFRNLQNEKNIPNYSQIWPDRICFVSHPKQQKHLPTTHPGGGTISGDPLGGNELGGNLTWDPPTDPLHVSWVEVGTERTPKPLQSSKCLKKNETLFFFSLKFFFLVKGAENKKWLFVYAFKMLRVGSGGCFRWSYCFLGSSLWSASG